MSDFHYAPALGGSALRDAIRESVRTCLDLERYQLFIRSFLPGRLYEVGGQWSF